MIGIIDYGAGNIRSLYNAFDWIGIDVVVSGDPRELRKTDRLVLPGVGAFGDAMAAIRANHIDELLEQEVRRGGKPLLGVCLGMQLLAKSSSEHGKHQGLDFFDASVELFSLADGFKVPHVGWNEVDNPTGAPFYDGLKSDQMDFYFVHSFHVKCADTSDIVSSCDYGGLFVAAIAKDNVVDAQFHPEKSQDNGIRFLENFINWEP